MRILHTSDWHIGRTFFERSTLDAARHALAEVPRLINKHEIDVVIAAGDIFDSANPNKEAINTLRDIFTSILETGAKLVVTSGNHDSAARLGLVGTFSAGSGLHLFTEVEDAANPLELTDSFGAVDFYGIPFIEPSLHRKVEWMPDDASDQHGALAAAMTQIRSQVQSRKTNNRRSVVVSHTFVAGAESASSDSERSITRAPLEAGGVDNVPPKVFDGVDYVALGHIHSRKELKHNLRYSGAVVHYSFKEAGTPRGGWLVDLVPDKEPEIQWVDFPILRELTEIRGTFEELLTKADFEAYKDHFIRAVYTDQTSQFDAIRKLQTSRFPFCVEVRNEPQSKVAESKAAYRDRVQGKTDAEIIEQFLLDVRNGVGATKEERAALKQAIEQIIAAEDSK